MRRNLSCCSKQSLAGSIHPLSRGRRVCGYPSIRRHRGPYGRVRSSGIAGSLGRETTATAGACPGTGRCAPGEAPPKKLWGVPNGTAGSAICGAMQRSARCRGREKDLADIVDSAASPWQRTAACPLEPRWWACRSALKLGRRTTAGALHQRRPPGTAPAHPSPCGVLPDSCIQRTARKGKG